MLRRLPAQACADSFAFAPALALALALAIVSDHVGLCARLGAPQ